LQEKSRMLLVVHCSLLRFGRSRVKILTFFSVNCAADFLSAWSTTKLQLCQVRVMDVRWRRCRVVAPYKLYYLLFNNVPISGAAGLCLLCRRCYHHESCLCEEVKDGVWGRGGVMSTVHRVVSMYGAELAVYTCPLSRFTYWERWRLTGFKLSSMWGATSAVCPHTSSSTRYSRVTYTLGFGLVDFLGCTIT